jgi:hypothetical protein
MPKQSDPHLRCPHYMRLHGWQKVLYLCHQDCASECSEVPLNSSKDPLSLPGWEVPYYCYSLGGGSYDFWPRKMLIPCIIGRSHGSHICMQQTYARQIRWHTKNDIYNKNDIKKNYICKKKNYKGGDLPISLHTSPGGTGILGSLEKSIPAYG